MKQYECDLCGYVYDEAAACFILGSLLLRVLPRVPALKGRIASSRI